MKVRLPSMGLLSGFVRLFLPDYGHTVDTPTATDPTLDSAQELPVTRNPDAAMSAQYEDHVATMDVDAHANARKCLPLQIAVSKLATGIATLDWEARGGNPARAQWLVERVQACFSFGKLVENFCWSLVEGARYHQLKPNMARGGMFIAFDFDGGAAYKQSAGGVIHNDGVNLYEVRRQDLDKMRPERILNPRDWIKFLPGLTSNPEGDTTLGMSLVPIVAAWHDGIHRIKQSAKAAGFPVVLIEHAMATARRPSTQGAAMAANANALSQVRQTGGVLSMSDEAKARILEPTPGMLSDLWESAINISGMCYTAILHNSLTTQTMDAGPTGSTYVSLSEEQRAIFTAACKFIEAVNRQAVPTLFLWNAGFNVPPLNAGEEECYLWPKPIQVATPGSPSEHGTGDVDDKDSSNGGTGNDSAEEDGSSKGAD